METADVIIVGGGIWGLSIAYHLSLAKPGKVVLLERNSGLARETTEQSAGQVGQLRGDPVLARAVGYTLELLREFAPRTGHDPQFVQCGSLHLSLRDQRTSMFRELHVAAQGLGVATEFVAHDVIRELAPHVETAGIDAALYVPHDGYVDARACALAYGAAAQDQGCELRLSTEVCELSRGDATIRVRTRDTIIETCQLVLAGGPWTSQLARSLCIYPPMYPIRLQQARTCSLAIPAHHPVLRVPDMSCYVRPERGGFLYGFFDPQPKPFSLHEQPTSFRTADIQAEPTLVEESQERLSGVLPLLRKSPVQQYRQGMMTCTPDGRFVIGPAGGSDASAGAQVWLATGCGGTGIAASGAVGRWIADWILQGAPTDDLACYAPGRFGDQASDLGWLRDRACETSAAYYRLASPTAD